jgi:hypothetical protein
MIHRTKQMTGYKSYLFIYFRKFEFSEIHQVFLDMLRKSEAKAAVAHRSAPQRHRRTPSVLTKRAPAPSPDAVGGRIALSRTFVAPAFTAEVSLLHQVCQVACSKE